MNAPSIATTPDIEALIAAHAPVAIGVSGGKDSQAAALATFDHLDALGHRGARVLIHADLGSVEWNDSLPTCRRLAEQLGCELIVVARKAGGMVERWESRWASSRRRYATLETVTLVLPWSTPSMRFCTSELKTHVIGAELRRRFKGVTFINVTGVRRQESTARAKGTIASLESDGKAFSWRPISDWTTEEVFAGIRACGLAPHQAYTDYGLTRVSCRFCIMSSMADLTAAAGARESHELYRHLVSLEVRSTFGFQGARWLADVAPQLLSDSMRVEVDCAKQKAATRVALEKRITKEMLYVSGWPTRLLTDQEAGVLAEVRTQVSSLLGIQAQHLEAPSIHERYAQLIAANEARSKQTA
jgi:3'-phosphoadenosine 5'-phosphosulfate sulfotransferase (PAPS reductase)/FAD synthetase